MTHPCAHHPPASPPDTGSHHGAGEIAWSLKRIYPGLDDAAVEADEKRAAALVADLVEQRQRVQDPALSPAAWCEIIRDYERFQTIAQRLRAFGYLHAAVDQKDSTKTALHQRLEEAQQRWSADLLFIEVTLRQLPKERLQALIDAPELAEYRHFLRRQRAQAAYTLSESEERVLAKKEIAGRRALVRFRSEYAAKMDFGRFEIDGEEREVTESDLAALRYHPDRDLREQARLRLFETYRSHLDVFSFLYTNIVKDHGIDCELRGYARAMDAENVPNEIDGEIVDALIEVNRRHLPMIHDFYGWRAKQLGYDRLKTSDLYVPLTKEEPRKIAWSEALDYIDRAMRRFSPEFAARGRRFFEEQRIDAPPRKGKSGGAFCYPIPEKDPFILVNYTGNISSVVTLAHELGHGIHFMLSWEHEPLLQAYWMSKVIAETASEFNELLLTDLLLEEITDPAIRRALLGLMVDRFLGTVDRQLMFTEFEEAAHKRIAAQPTGADALGEIWTDLCKQHYGPHVDLLPPEGNGWALVPHFVFNPFYCYSYALSQVVVLALYATYKQQGADFVAGYLELLGSGGNGTPEELLGKAGVDLRDRAVLERAYSEFERLLGALREEVEA
ncbi:MAG: hypothetical protein GF330_08075 [Candidatus Eisenbacteria bacterium]|nr:hypothetical protein [Candidatus Eisenbacteria bacterium]